MLDLSRTLLALATGLLALALLVNVVVVATRRRAPAATAVRPVAVGRGGSHPVSPLSPAALDDDGPVTAVRTSKRGVAWAADRSVELALLAITVALVIRSIHTGHAPFANQYEFACSFAWGITAAYVFFERRYGVRALSLMVLPLPLAMLGYASTVGSEASGLMPALQNHLLLTAHVITAVIAYGAAGVSAGAAVLYLLRPHLKFPGLPSEDLLEEIGYRAIVIAFPMLTIMIILGAIWADIAWGRYWSWDPKETSALVTWLIYGGYLHARVVRDWRGKKTAALLLLGFAAVLFTFFGNLFFGGLHSYA
ncbi:c-type cytochrome biogenesis protein CcsB [Propioniciclava sinopodophylli]|jgi:ABC-type transport system involved in cytochrome c biogenesis permease subunit|uniref:C-type cytochrome biogenesis protein CcsB n=1 Tax=Propioniciclava sinopodophylli TaxID=1837344 RepID=A0A4Q9KC37_9ACTN|nr:cytochrome c biogenesis protein CcsA [Propioniciclava sinopodophylli]TBT83345.1 c-type cytochrome biogenesis protein CcsB [Propioniciclava sinopodophylli]